MNEQRDAPLTSPEPKHYSFKEKMIITTGLALVLGGSVLALHMLDTSRASAAITTEYNGPFQGLYK